MDTVAEGDPAQWTHPPFTAQQVGDRLYGRGAAGNKAGLACGLYTLAPLRDAGLLEPARARVLLAGVVDEESGASSAFGVRFLLDLGRLPVQDAIYTYTSDNVCIGHRGVLRLTLTAQRGFDARSLIADPGFARPDFDQPGKESVELLPDSPSLRLGFQPIDLTQVGIRPE